MIDKIYLKLEAPIVALEKIAVGKRLPKIFANAAIIELKKAQQLLDDLKVVSARKRKADH